MNFQPVLVEEVLGRARQGVTRPFLCRGENGLLYFAKGIGAGRRSQICEWVAAQLATAFDLPIASYALLDVPEELLTFLPEGRELGAGIVFGSCQLPHTQELNIRTKHSVSSELARRVLLFDWWIHNEDRHLTNRGGNPNLLWDNKTAELRVIDHNQAFDRHFDAKQFLQSHVFATYWNSVSSDLLLRQMYKEKMCAIFGKIEEIKASIPEAWWFVDVGVPADITWGEIVRCLERCQTDALWELS